MVESVDAWREATVKAEYLRFEQGCQGQVVEKVAAHVVNFQAGSTKELSLTLVVEAVDLGDLATLVIAPQDRDAVLEAHLQANQQCDRLHTVVASVDVVPHEQVVCVG